MNGQREWRDKGRLARQKTTMMTMCESSWNIRNIFFVCLKERESILEHFFWKKLLKLDQMERKTFTTRSIGFKVEFKCVQDEWIDQWMWEQRYIIVQLMLNSIRIVGGKKRIQCINLSPVLYGHLKRMFQTFWRHTLAGWLIINDEIMQFC